MYQNVKPEEVLPGADWYLVPDHMQTSVCLYLEYGIPPGAFLTAVLTNNLFETVGRADHINKANILNWCTFVWNYMPSASWGDKDTVRDWMAMRSEATRDMEI